MKQEISEVLKVRCVQHPNGTAWITADKRIPDHWKVLAEKEITVEFSVDLGFDHNRSFPAGKIDPA